jgi:methyl-accepting chemotaxis protein
MAQRLAAGLALPLATLLAIGAVTYRNTASLVETSRRVAHTHAVLEKLEALLATATDAETGQRGFLLTGDERFLEPYVAATQRLGELEHDVKTLAADNPAQQHRLDAADRLLAGKLAELKETIEVRRTRGLDAALAIVRSDAGKRLMDSLRAVVGEMESDEQTLLERRAADADATARATTSSILYGTLLALLLASLGGFVVVRGVTQHVRSGVVGIVSSANEILAATAQQAAGATAAAAAVQETSTTVEEVKRTSQVAFEKAEAVAEAAQRTAAVSRDGGRAVEECVHGMRESKERMESLAERVLALSQQAQTIGEIIATVNELAEQSNILAVNAAIEAAKAGETGRGFAVVAAEVKALAERSKQATGQVRAILAEIQRATQGAVMAAEQGVKTAETGVGVAARAGESIAVLTQGVNEAAQAAQQILASAQQQAAGMDQIALAMRNIHQSSTQNMASTRQMERAAGDLSALAHRLRALVARSGDGAATAPGRGMEAATG